MYFVDKIMSMHRISNPAGRPSQPVGETHCMLPY